MLPILLKGLAEAGLGLELMVVVGVSTTSLSSRYSKPGNIFKIEFLILSVVVIGFEETVSTFRLGQRAKYSN
jgi:hypothetical protein